MTDGTLRQLAQLTHARFQVEQAKLRDITAAEARLRRAVADLEQQHRAAQDLQRGDVTAHHSIGGDVLWQGWVGRSRRSLQMQLAQVLVLKGQKMQALQLAHGRKLASDRLVEDARKEDAAIRQKEQNEQEQRLTLLEAACRAGQE